MTRPGAPKEDGVKRTAAVALLAALAAPAWGQWTGWGGKDPMDDSVHEGVASPWAKPTKPMADPYRGTKAVAGLVCGDSPREVYLRFTAAPNLARGQTRSGYNELRMRVRFDQEPAREVRVEQAWGSDQLSLAGDSLREDVLRAGAMLVEVPWHGQGNVYFRFSLAGSRKAFERQCAEALAEERAAAKEGAKRKLRTERTARKHRYVQSPDLARKTVRDAGLACPELAPGVASVWALAGGNVAVKCVPPPGTLEPGAYCVYVIDMMTGSVSPSRSPYAMDCSRQGRARAGAARRRAEQAAAVTAAPKPAAKPKPLPTAKPGMQGYRAKVRAHVARFWPEGLAAGGGCTLRATLQSIRGKVVRVDVVEGSQGPAFDRAARRAVVEASPLPPPSDRKLFDRDLVFACPE